MPAAASTARAARVPNIPGGTCVVSHELPAVDCGDAGIEEP